MDAQGLKWSPCGRWIAVWDSAASGYKVLIYTADGHLFRTREKACEGLGIKTVEWSPASEFLVVGSYDGRISFLSTYTFSPVIEMNHTMTVNIQAIPVWSETVLANKERHYSPLPQPVVLPTVSSTPADAYARLGVSVVAFNVDSTLVATRSDNMPTAVWIWSLKLLRPFAILVHLAPVRSVEWHPTIPDLLMLTCAPDPSSKDQNPAVYIWCASWKQPRAVLLPMERAGQNNFCKWINNPHVSATHSNNGSISGELVRGTSPDKHTEAHQPALIFGSKDGFVVGFLEEEEFDPEDMKKETAEDDSFLYSADKHNWSPRDWAYYSPSRASVQANSVNHASSPSPTRRNVVTQKTKEGDEATVDYRANRRITMKS